MSPARAARVEMLLVALDIFLFYVINICVYGLAFGIAVIGAVELAANLPGWCSHCRAAAQLIFGLDRWPS